MAENLVRYTGFSVSLEDDGYAVTVFWRLSAGRLQECAYTALTWAETVDVILAELGDHRPGWACGDGWAQPALF